MTEPDPLAMAAMVAYCGWDPTTPVTETVNLDGNGSPLLTLPSLHVTAVTNVTVTGRCDSWTYSSTDDPATIGPGGCVSWSENGCLVASTAWPEGVGNIAVTYTGGYDGPPDDLVAALASVSRRTSSAVFGVTSTRMGSAAVTFGPAATGLLLVEQMVFDRYRLPRAA